MRIIEISKKFKQPIQYLGSLLLIVGIFATNSLNALAVNSSNSAESLFLQDLKNELIRNIGNRTTLADLQVSNLSNKEQVPSLKKLTKLSIYLRDFARNLSPNLPVKNTMITTSQRNYTITDIKLPNGTWNTLNVGHTLKLITQEMEIINNSQPQPKIQVLIKSDLDSIYQPLIDLPLNQFCNLLLENFEF
ncbi:hypothetical protein WJM97_23030 (plasmid) [Okeanomitos corallinicola TIOX110]|uniref:Uncharacterized protein n=1 Tax=Okeanomitos corallinicola TIOX110 TaxID=3133117 RepID=A0ABZ2UZD9_9CYAN